MDNGGPPHAPAALHPEKRHGPHCTGRCVGLGADLDGREKISPPPSFEPLTVRPLAIRRTNCAIPCLTKSHTNSKRVQMCWIRRERHCLKRRVMSLRGVMTVMT